MHSKESPTTDPNPKRKRGIPVGRAEISALAIAFVTAAALAQSDAERKANDRAALERLALAKARSALVEQVRELLLEPGLTVGNWAAGEITTDRELRRWVRSLPPHASPRFYSDGSCDVDVRLEPDALCDRLIALRGQMPAARKDALTENTLRAAGGRWPMLWGAGVAMPGEIQSDGVKRPPGWEDVTDEGMQIARRAAIADALHAVLNQARRLKVTHARRLGEFLDAGEAVESAVLAAVESAATATVELVPDQVAEAEARLRMADLIRILTEVHKSHDAGLLFHTGDFREMALHTKLVELRATGLAVPPSRTMVGSPYRMIELDAPPWVGGTLEASARYEPWENDGLCMGLRAEIARLDGIDRLRRRVEALVVRGDLTVGELLTRRPEMKCDVSLFLNRACRTGRPKTQLNGSVEVRLELPLERVWRIVRRGFDISEEDRP